MKVYRYIIIFILLMFLFIGNIYSQDEEIKEKADTVKVLKTVGDKSRAGGIFLAPFLGLDAPLSALRSNSKYAITLGIRLEYATQAIYPFAFFVQYQSQKHPGSDIYKTVNLINSMDTKITSFGGGFYFLANKYLRSNFTSPFLIGEIKFYNIKRTIVPDIEYEGITKSESKIALSLGVGFTLYIFDIITSYNFVKDYNTLSIKTQFHFPLFKF